MTARLSRRKLARYAAAQYAAGVSVTGQLAAYLVETRRYRELDRLVRDIESELARLGIAVADVTTAGQLSHDMKAAVSDLITAKTGAADIRLREHQDPTVLGGVRVDLPDESLDATIQRKLATIRKAKI